jgi:hypothetical protein
MYLASRRLSGLCLCVKVVGWGVGVEEGKALCGSMQYACTRRCHRASQSPPDSPTTRLSLATNVLIDQTGHAWLVVA